MNATDVITSTTLVLGHDGDWWDFWMLASLIIVGVVALAAAAFTTGSVLVHKREAAAASAALERYKLETDGKVAGAKSAGIAAGEKAGHAQADVDAAKVELAKQKTLTATATAEAEKAAARAAEANLKAENLRQQNLELEAALAPRVLEQFDSAAPLREISGISAIIESVNDEEAWRLAGQIAFMIDKSIHREGKFVDWTVLPGMRRVTNADFRDGVSVEGPPSWRSGNPPKLFIPRGVVVDPNELKTAEAADTLVAILLQNHVEATRHNAFPEDLPANTIRIRVGFKPQTVGAQRGGILWK